MLSNLNLIGSELERLNTYKALLLNENQKINLVSRKLSEKDLEAHIYDSLAMMNFVKFSKNSRIADMGSGGGLPAIPLAIMNPSQNFYLIESKKKKADFLFRAIQLLDLKNSQIIHNRVENISRLKEYNRTFDFVLARAVAKISRLIYDAAPLLRDGGELISYKSSSFYAELKASEKAQKQEGLRFKDCFEYDLPKDYGKRAILVFKNEFAKHICI